MKKMLFALGLLLAVSVLILSGCGKGEAEPSAVPPSPTAAAALTPTAAAAPTPTAPAATAVAPTAVAESATSAPSTVSGWERFTNEKYGYSFEYPAECFVGPMPADCKSKPPEERDAECLCFLDAEDPDRVHLEAFTGEKDNLKGAAFWVARLAPEPAPGADLIAFMRERLPQSEIPDEPNVTVGGIPGVRLYTPASPMAYSSEEIYFIKDDLWFQIMMHDVDDENNRELYERISIALDIAAVQEGVTEDEIADWKTYTNERYGYALNYPPDCTFGPMPAGCKAEAPEDRPAECLCFLDAEDPDRVHLEAFTGEKDDLKGAAFWVARLAPEPAPGADLIAFMRERLPQSEIPDEPNVTVGGIPGVRLYTPASPMAYSSEEIYFIKDDLWFQIMMHDVDDENNRELYERISLALDIAEVGAAGEGMDTGAGWAIYTQADPEYGFSFRYPKTWELQDGSHRVTLSQGSMELMFAFRRDYESIAVLPSGVPAGELMERDTVDILGQVVTRVVLVRDGHDKGVYYGNVAEIHADGMTFAIILSEHDADADFSISAEVQAEADGIAASLMLSGAQAGVTEEAVDGWVGTMVRLPPGSQFGDAFEREDGQRFGIGQASDAQRAQLDDARWTGIQIKLWGQLVAQAAAFGGQQIQVERLEVVSGPAQEPRNLSPFAFTFASSTLPTDQWSGYDARQVIDGLPETAWAEAGHRGHEPEPSGPGIGEWIMLVFPEAIEVHRIGVDAGLDRNADIFGKNNRLKKATITFSKGEQVELEFEDVRGVQMRDIPAITTTYVQVVIDEVYPGSSFDDTCIAEIEVWGVTE